MRGQVQAGELFLRDNPANTPDERIIMKLQVWALAAGAAMLLSACTTDQVRQNIFASSISRDIDAARELSPAGDDWMDVYNKPANGNSFTAYLSRNYKSLMLFEADEMYDYVSADMYARRALTTSKGTVIDPLPLGEFNLPASHLPALKQARADIADVFSKGAREKFPVRAARVQSSFDCWVEQQEENHQPDHIARCRDEFVLAMKELKKAMTPPPAPKVVKADPPAPKKAETVPTFEESYIVYFDFDSDKLTANEVQTVNEVVRALKALNAGASIIGHADTSGPAAYNQALSERRANAVSKRLLEAGIRPTVVTTQGRGEADLAKPTADNVKEPKNRRVVINIR